MAVIEVASGLHGEQAGKLAEVVRSGLCERLDNVPDKICAHEEFTIEEVSITFCLVIFIFITIILISNRRMKNNNTAIRYFGCLIYQHSSLSTPIIVTPIMVLGTKHLKLETSQAGGHQRSQSNSSRDTCVSQNSLLPLHHTAPPFPTKVGGSFAIAWDTLGGTGKGDKHLDLRGT